SDPITFKTNALIRVTINNDTDSAAAVSVINEVFELKPNDEKGQWVGSATNDLKISAHETGQAQNEINVDNPKLWTLENPQRYVVVTSIEQNGE
ncbi:hypothetical protein, partial [Klebsiella pneumoniae]|uniref:hypothetical protein n=1 Tax=Klebsiella pneumoniae TaxID=573 RepID=UPI0030131F6F